MGDKKMEYISLNEAAKSTAYSQEYISLLCREGKMKGKKMGRNWFTTKEWVKDYIEKMSEKKNKKDNDMASQSNYQDNSSSFLLLKKMMLATIVSGFLVSGFVFAQYFGTKVHPEIQFQNLVLGVSDGVGSSIRGEIISLSNDLNFVKNKTTKFADEEVITFSNSINVVESEAIANDIIIKTPIFVGESLASAGYYAPLKFGELISGTVHQTANQSGNILKKTFYDAQPMINKI